MIIPKHPALPYLGDSLSLSRRHRPLSRQYQTLRPIQHNNFFIVTDYLFKGVFLTDLILLAIQSLNIIFSDESNNGTFDPSQRPPFLRLLRRKPGHKFPVSHADLDNHVDFVGIR